MSDTVLLDDIVLLTPDDVCKILSVKKSWLYDEVQAGRIPHVRLGQRLRFKKTDIVAYIDGLAEILDSDSPTSDESEEDISGE